MPKEEMTIGQTIAIIIMFLFGSSVIMGINTEAKQDSWISLILAIFIATIIMIMYARVLKLFPGYGLFDIIDTLFGKVISKIFIILMTIYAINLGAIVLIDFFDFIQITSLQHTPEVLISMIMIFLCIYIARSSISTFGKWGVVTLTIVLLMVVITIIFSIGNMNLTNILPIFESEPKMIVQTAFKTVTFPFTELVLLLPLACFIKKGESPYKTLFLGVILGGIILLIIVIRNLFVLGAPLMTYSFFPSYTAARVIEIGDFITRIEAVIAINFVLAGITKIIVCLIAASQGVAKIFKLRKYHDLVLPVGLVMVALSMILFEDIFELFDFTNNYWLFIIPYHFVIPIIVWIKAEINARSLKKVV